MEVALLVQSLPGHNAELHCEVSGTTSAQSCGAKMTRMVRRAVESCKDAVVTSSQDKRCSTETEHQEGEVSNHVKASSLVGEMGTWWGRGQSKAMGPALETERSSCRC